MSIFKKFYLLIITLVVLILGGCGNTEFTSSMITYDGEYIKWEAPKGISSFKLSINGGEEFTVNNTEYKFTANETFTVSITTVPSKSGKEKTAEKTFAFLGQVKNVRIVDSNITWDLVEGADRYQVQIGNKVVNSNVRVNSFALRDSDVGLLNIRVMALKDGNANFSNWSEALYVNILTTPVNIRYVTDTPTKRLVWDPVSGASSYGVRINNGELITTTNAYLDYDSEQKSFVVEVKAMGNNASTTVDSKFSEKKEYLYLSPVTTYDMENGILTWQPIPNATSYKLRIGNQIITLTECRYDQLLAGQSYNIEIMPVAEGTNYFSQWSPTTPINILFTPNVSINDKIIVWDSVSNANGYEVVITKGEGNAKVYTTTQPNLQMGTMFDDNGSYSIQVKALTTQASYYDSKLSSPVTVIRLAAPSSKTITDNPLLPNATVVNFAGVQSASGYTVVYNDVETQDILGTQFTIGVSDGTNPAVNSVIKVSVKAKGSVNTATKTYILDSIETLTFELTRLATPGNLSVNNGLIQWDAVPSAFGYVVTIDDKNTEVISTATSLIVPALSPGKHNIKVRAKGNGSNYISSLFSSDYQVTKLPAPMNVKVSAPSGNSNSSTLSWGSVDGCSGYTVVINTRIESLNATTNSTVINATDISVDGTAITIKALGNGAQIIDSDISKTETLIRLKAPTKLSLMSDNIVWNAPSNAGSYVVSYIVFRGTDTNQVATTTAPSWSASNLIQGTNNLMVQAIGDGVSTFNSEISTPTTFTKLAPVNLRIGLNRLDFEWDIIPGAEQYSYTLDGINWVNLPKTATLFKPVFTSGGDKTIRIRAMGSDANNVYQSNETTMTLKVMTLPQLPQANVKFAYENSTLTIQVENYENLSPADTNTFDFSIGGVSNEKNSNTFTYSVTGNPTLTVKVFAKGGFFSSDNKTFYLDSTAAFEKTIKILAAPSDIGIIEVNYQARMYTVNWDRNGTGIYDVKITLLNAMGEVVDTITKQATTNHEYTLTLNENVKSIKVEIRKVGNQNTEFTSDFVEKVFPIVSN